MHPVIYENHVLNKDGGNEVGLGAASSTVFSSPVLEARREKAGHECEALPIFPRAPCYPESRRSDWGRGRLG